MGTDQPETNRPKSRASYTIALLLFLFGCSCEGTWHWKTFYVSPSSPDGR
jgi:hypothetical protein